MAMVGNTLVTALSDLHRHGPISGACLILGDFIVANHLPVSDSKAGNFCAVVREMCDGYQSVGRNITEFYFGYDRGSIIVFCEGRMRLALLVDLGADMDQLGTAGRHFLIENAPALQQLNEADLTQRISVREEPAPIVSNDSGPITKPDDIDHSIPEASVPGEEEPATSEEEWEEFRDKLHLLLSRVIGSGQSTRMIDRVVKEHGYGKQLPLRIDFQSIAESMVERIPNKSKRKSIRSLVDELLRHMRLY